MSQSLGRLLTQTLDLYRNTDGTGMVLVTSGVACVPLTKFESHRIFVDYPNYKPFDLMETYVVTSGVQPRDEVLVDTVRYAVNEVNPWPETLYGAEEYYQIVLEATVD